METFVVNDILKLKVSLNLCIPKKNSQNSKKKNVAIMFIVLIVGFIIVLASLCFLHKNNKAFDEGDSEFFDRNDLNATKLI